MINATQKPKGNLMNYVQSIMPNYCDKCGTKYNNSDLEIINNGEGRVMCKVGCHNCGNNYMLQINSPMDGVLAAKRTEFKSEMTTKEISKFESAQEIEPNEVIDFHDYLKTIESVEDLNKSMLKGD